MVNETHEPEVAPENKTIQQRALDSLTPYRIAGAVLFTLFAGADISLYFFGRDATGSTLLAMIITLLSGAGFLIWKYLRDHKRSNETQRSTALLMICLHALAAVVFLVGNFAKGGWDTLAEMVKIDGVLASQLLDYQVVLEKTFLWTIGIMLIANIIAHFYFQENDTEKKQERMLAKIARDERYAQLKAQENESRIAASEYKKYSDSFAQVKGLRNTRQRIIDENQGKLPAETIAQMLAPIDEKLAVAMGLIPVPPADANTAESASAPFSKAPSRTQ